jgi:hypothetical protein
MTWREWVVVGLALLPRLAFADPPVSAACVDVREQLETLQAGVPVYKQLSGDQRQYLDDGERPAELARIQKEIAANCSADPQAEATEHAAAARLHQARSPECAVERDTLAAMEKPDSRESPDSVRKQRQLVADHCPQVATHGVWLRQQVWARPAG